MSVPDITWEATGQRTYLSHLINCVLIDGIYEVAVNFFTAGLRLGLGVLGRQQTIKSSVTSDGMGKRHLQAL